MLTGNSVGCHDDGTSRMPMSYKCVSELDVFSCNEERIYVTLVDRKKWESSKCSKGGSWREAV